uniref:Uncharacterized protein n=1 Tax=Anguilla anguilla TaxID=7936 RepID=A0A0E9S3U6_ANGAN
MHVSTERSLEMKAVSEVREFTPSRPQRRFRTDTTAVAAGRRDGHKK